VLDSTYNCTCLNNHTVGQYCEVVLYGTVLEEFKTVVFELTESSDILTETLTQAVVAQILNDIPGILSAQLNVTLVESDTKPGVYIVSVRVASSTTVNATTVIQEIKIASADNGWSIVVGEDTDVVNNDDTVDPTGAFPLLLVAVVCLIALVVLGIGCLLYARVNGRRRILTSKDSRITYKVPL
jgi:hypothetical protein